MDNIYFKKSLKLVIYTIGYSKEGESLLILIKADDVISYSIVIDGYKVGDNNITCRLLEEEGIQQIDVFCWSHPDKDHSVGIEDYIPFINGDTQIVLGNGFELTMSNWEKSNPVMYEFIGNELKKTLTKKDRIKIRTVCTGMKCKEMKFADARTGIEYPFELNAFAPDSYLNIRREFLHRDFPHNEISVGLDIRLGDMMAVFCADVPNVVFNSVADNDFPEIIDYIKIPHHCSTSSDKLLNLFKNQADVACTTVNVANGLPNRNLLGQYKAKVKQVFCTNDLEKEEQEEIAGVIKTSFLIDNERKVNNFAYGNAKEVV